MDSGEMINLMRQVIQALDTMSHEARQAGQESEAITTLACKLRIVDALDRYVMTLRSDRAREAWLAPLEAGAKQH